MRQKLDCQVMSTKSIDFWYENFWFISQLLVISFKIIAKLGKAYYTPLLFAGILLCNWRFNMKYTTYLFVHVFFIHNHVTVLADQNKVYSDKVKEWSENVQCPTVISSSARIANFKHYYIVINIETCILTILCREYNSNYQ